jgi:hypothetical protein
LYLLHFQTWLLGLVPAIAFPMALLCFFLMKFFGPLTFMSQPSSRWFVLSSLREILKSPFGRLTFREQFIADILTSLIKVIVDVERSLCFYLTGSWLSSAPVIQPGVDVFDAPRCHEINLYAVAALSVLPLWLRFMQTLRRYYNTGQRFPHFANAMKYALSQTVVFMGIFHPLYTHTSIHDWNWHRWVWLFLGIASALYTFSWDVTMDWGLFGSDASAAKGAAPHHHHGFGRRLLFHRHRWVRDLAS